MSRTIFCTFLKTDAEGQDFQLYQVKSANVSITKYQKRRGHNG